MTTYGIGLGRLLKDRSDGMQFIPTKPQLMIAMVWLRVLMAYMGRLLDGEALGLRVEEVDKGRHEKDHAGKEQEDAPLHAHLQFETHARTV